MQDTDTIYHIADIRYKIPYIRGGRQLYLCCSGT